jgi:hypothetical protein
MQKSSRKAKRGVQFKLIKDSGIAKQIEIILPEK